MPWATNTAAQFTFLVDLPIQIGISSSILSRHKATEFTKLFFVITKRFFVFFATLW